MTRESPCGPPRERAVLSRHPARTRSSTNPVAWCATPLTCWIREMEWSLQPLTRPFRMFKAEAAELDADVAKRARAQRRAAAIERRAREQRARGGPNAAETLVLRGVNFRRAFRAWMGSHLAGLLSPAGA
jgi:hypothetical protein